MNGYIYKIHNLVNGKKYVGQTRMQNVKIRFKNHKNSLKNGKHPNDFLQHAWDKYGEDNFKFEVIKTVTHDDIKDLIEELNILEVFYIKELQSMYYQEGYNLREGGDSKQLSDYSRKKISDKNRGKVRTQEYKDKMSKIKTGTTLSEETKKKLSEMRKGEKHWAYGKKMSRESVEKMRKELSQNYRFFSEDEKEQIIHRIYFEAESVKKIADSFGVHYNVIRRIKEGFLDQLCEEERETYFSALKNKQNELKAEKELSKKQLNGKPEKQIANKIKFTKEQFEDICKMRLEKVPIKEIGKMYGVSAKPIKRLLIENNMSHLIERPSTFRKKDL